MFRKFGTFAARQGEDNFPGQNLQNLIAQKKNINAGLFTASKVPTSNDREIFLDWKMEKPMKLPRSSLRSQML